MRDRNAPIVGIALTICAFLLLFLGWFFSQMARTHTFDKTLEIDQLKGYGIVDRSPSGKLFNSTVRGSSGTVVYWPPLQALPEEGDTRTYPHYKSLLDLVSAWNPDTPDPPAEFHETLQHFNYSDPAERAMAEQYRNAELPFKLYDVPGFYKVSRKWTDAYLQENMVDQLAHVEQSESNHFMYWNTNGANREGYIPPTELVDLSFSKWLRLAHRADENKITSDAKHYYFMMGSPPRDRGSNFISRDLKLFSTKTNNFFITDTKANKGIQCRFGMRGIVAEAHYDSGRNMVAMLRGEKRYILSPPSACKKLGIITDVRHPSFRHSIIDWSDPKQAKQAGFRDVDAIDTIVRTGEVLYIPSYWFHYIASLKISIQCNSRSGSPPNREGESVIDDCMGGQLEGKKKKKRKIPM